MKNKLISAIILLAVLALVFFLTNPKKTIAPVNNVQEDQLVNLSQNTGSDASQNDFSAPLSRASERVSKKPFGIYITPGNSPVQPERFSGYHTGSDFEIFPEEIDIDVPVKAVCDGKLRLKEYASGYGGMAVEECESDGKPITIVYGHLDLSSIALKVGDVISAGDEIGILGKDKSVETDGERKHLHLGIHKGSAINIRGYVSSKAGLSDWIDPCSLICGK